MSVSTFTIQEELLRALESVGWQVERSTSSDPLLPGTIRLRYLLLSEEVTGFLSSLDLCTNRDQTVWFMCREDYVQTDVQRFSWDFCESLNLETAARDVEWQSQIRSFWDKHFPFMLAVHSDYDYLAISLDEDSKGSIVHGFAPDFELPSVVASSFAEFLTRFKDVVEGRNDEYPLSLFL